MNKNSRWIIVIYRMSPIFCRPPSPRPGSCVAGLSWISSWSVGVHQGMSRRHRSAKAPLDLKRVSRRRQWEQLSEGGRYGGDRLRGQWCWDGRRLTGRCGRGVLIYKLIIYGIPGQPACADISSRECGPENRAHFIIWPRRWLMQNSR